MFNTWKSYNGRAHYHPHWPSAFFALVWFLPGGFLASGKPRLQQYTPRSLPATTGASDHPGHHKGDWLTSLVPMNQLLSVAIRSHKPSVVYDCLVYSQDAAKVPSSVSQLLSPTCLALLFVTDGPVTVVVWLMLSVHMGQLSQLQHSLPWVLALTTRLT